MSYNCCSGNVSSRSFRCYRPSSVSSCVSSYPSNLVYSSSCSPSPWQQGSSLHHGRQDICDESSSCQRPCVVSRPCQTSCRCPRSSAPCSPGQLTDSGLRDFGSRSCYSGDCGSSHFRSLNDGVFCFPSLSFGSRFYYPTYFASRTCQPFCYRPSTEFGFCRFNC